MVRRRTLGHFQSQAHRPTHTKQPRYSHRQRATQTLPLSRTSSDITTPSKWLAVPLVGEYIIAQTVGSTFPASKCLYWTHGRYCAFRPSGDVLSRPDPLQRLFADICTATATASKDPPFIRVVLRPETFNLDLENHQSAQLRHRTSTSNRATPSGHYIPSTCTNHTTTGTSLSLSLDST